MWKGTRRECRKRFGMQTHVDVSLAVSQEQVVHDGAIVQILQCRHVLNARRGAATAAHGPDLVMSQCVLLVRVHLKHKKVFKFLTSSSLKLPSGVHLEKCEIRTMKR